MKGNMFTSLITSVLDILLPPRIDEKKVRELSDESFFERVSVRTVQKCAPSATVLLSFADSSVRATIHEAKYHHNPRAIELLGLVMRDYLIEMYSEEGFGKTVLIPIPLSKERGTTRGYNQTEEILREAVKDDAFDITPDNLLRIRDTVSQTKLSRVNRMRNMRGAFSAAHVALDKNKTYIIFDDVITTGATMQEAIDALTKGGAKHILPLALAH